MDETALTEISAGPAHDSLRRGRESSPTVSAAVCSIPHVASQIEHAILVLALRCQDRRTPETLRIQNESGLISWELRARETLKKAPNQGKRLGTMQFATAPIAILAESSSLHCGAHARRIVGVQDLHPARWYTSTIFGHLCAVEHCAAQINSQRGSTR